MEEKLPTPFDHDQYRFTDRDKLIVSVGATTILGAAGGYAAALSYNADYEKFVSAQAVEDYGVSTVRPTAKQAPNHLSPSTMLEMTGGAALLGAVISTAVAKRVIRHKRQKQIAAVKEGRVDVEAEVAKLKVDMDKHNSRSDVVFVPEYLS